VSATARPPVNVKDALTEARAIAGGALGRPSTVPGSMSPTGVKARKTVLLVDPDASMRARMRAALEPYYDVLEAKDGMEAVEMAPTIQPPAMIVTENVMPRVDGFTLAKVLRQNPMMKKVPIMFVSSRNSPQDVTQAMVVGACQYVLKTTPVGDIVAKIRKIVV
jgi:PleD family two-component response regulator